MLKRVLSVAFFAALVFPAQAEERKGFFDAVHGDWYLTLGAAVVSPPEFEGSSKNVFRVAPLISVGKAGAQTRFSSRNDNISLAFIDTQTFRAGAVGKFLVSRKPDDSPDLAGTREVKWGGEIGGFAEVYPTDWMRVRGEVRQGVRAHKGVVADVSVDAFKDVTDKVRVSAGPRVSIASSNYFDAYYGVNAAESAASGLEEYHPGGGVKSVGVGGAVTWKATDKLTASLFGEYSRLTGAAADSPLVKQRGSENQFMIGVSTTYRFDFKIP